QSVAAQVQQVKAQMDAVAAKGKKKKKKGKEPEIILPNDPLYQTTEAQKKKAKKLLPIKIDTSIGIGGLAPPVTTSDQKANSHIKDQYALRIIGYTPFTDPNSAWNVVDGTQKNVVVAVVDSGLDMDHPDGPQYIWT